MGPADSPTKGLLARVGIQKRKTSGLATLRDRLRAFALTLPGAWEDHPWNEVVVKVNKKIFVFLGQAGNPEEGLVGVKLTASHAAALGQPDAAPMGYGLGRAGWVVIPLRDGTAPVDVLADWIEESYRIVAPKRLIAQLDARPAGTPTA